MLEGNDAIIEFFSNGDFKPLVCAENLTFQINQSLLPAKTVGDGQAEKFVPDIRGYTITCTGLIPWDSSDVVTWDMIDHLKQGVAAQYRIVFRDTSSNVIKTIHGQAFVTAVGINAPAANFVDSTITLTGNGDFAITNNMSGCDASIGNLSEDSETSTYIRFFATGLSPDTVRVEYQLDGGGYKLATKFGSTYMIQFLKYSGISAGDHTLTAWPVCELGNYGSPITLNFDVA